MIYSVGIFPGIFALGEKLCISGIEVIEAFIIAWDITAKLSLLAVKPLLLRGGVIPLFCTIGVVAASAKLLKFGLEEIIMAVSIAAFHTSWGAHTQTQLLINKYAHTVLFSYDRSIKCGF